MRLVLLLALLAAGGPVAFTVSLLGDGPLVIPPGVKVNGMTVGGLSAIVRIQQDTYKSLVDNEGIAAARVFDLQFAVTERGPAPPPGRTPAEVPRSVLRLVGLNGIDFDGEGLAVTPESTLLVSSEREPSIREISAAGKTLRSLPVPQLFKAAKIRRRGIRSNQGFEALALAATDVSGMDSLAGQTYTPISKTLLYDFAGSGFLVDNLEGMTFGPELPGGDRTLVLISDDNFEPLKQTTQIVALRLHSATRGGS